MKHTTFSPQFRKAAIKAGKELRLEETTSARQTKNGTIEFYDEVTKCFYALYESGYIRRSVRSGWYGNGTWKAYQLNPQNRIPNGTNYMGTPCYNTERVLLDGWGQLGKLASCVAAYRRK